MIYTPRRRLSLDRASAVLRRCPTALFTCIGDSAEAGWITASALLLTITLFLVLAAQVLAGVQFLRPSGPPGTLPVTSDGLREQSRWRKRLAKLVAGRLPVSRAELLDGGHESVSHVAKQFR
jgi:hypothetical protein